MATRGDTRIDVLRTRGSCPARTVPPLPCSYLLNLPPHTVEIPRYDSIFGPELRRRVLSRETSRLASYCIATPLQGSILTLS